MRLIIKSAKYEDNWEERDYFSIETDKNLIEFMDGEPEDAILRRDYNDVYTIPEMIKEAYRAGVNGEELTITDEVVDWDEI